MSRRYVDIHCHPSTKPFIKYASGLVKNRKPSLWDEIKYVLLFGFDEWAANDILDSQSSLSQLSEPSSSYFIIVNPVIPMERELAKYTQFQLAINFALPFPKQITKSYFNSLKEKTTPYSQRLFEELEFASDTEDVHLITHQNPELDVEQINILMAIEGGHSLYSSPKFEDSTSQVLSTLSSVRASHKIFYLTLCHLAPSPLANHCFSMKNVSKKNLHRFYPKNEIGISETGLRVIDQCLQSQNPTLIDVKHMSLASRLQFYKYRKEKGYEHPIVASHNGTTGLSIDNWKFSMLENAKKWERTVIDEKRYFGVIVNRPVGLSLRNIETVFNPSTINLFDEDIEEIILSDGIIGLSFDERMLGRGTKSHFLEVLAEEELRDLLANAATQLQETKEISAEEFNQHVNYYDVKMKQPTYRLSEVDKRKLRVQNTFKRATADALFFLNNLLYMIQVAKKVIDNHNLNRDPWQFFALGSDFDGVIDAIDSCRNAKKMANFEALLRQLLAEYLTKTDSFVDFGIRKEAAFRDIQQKLDLLCHINAVNFIQKYLQGSKYYSIK